MERRFFLHKNQAGSQAKVITFKKGDSLSSLKAACGKKLGIRAKKLFHATGAEVQTTNDLMNNTSIYVSSGEIFFKFLPPSIISNGQESLQVSVLGSGGVGKSAITLRFVRDYFMSDWDPTIEDAYRKAIDVDNKLCLLEILDTAGQDDFESLRAQWMIDRDAYVIVYSMDSRASLQQLEPFFQLYLQINENRRPMPPIVLVANKKDIVAKDPQKCQVTSEQGEKIARAFKATYIETSALTGENISTVFETLVQRVRESKEAKPVKKKSTHCIIL